MPIDVYKAVADPTRRRILDLLASSERHVSALVEPFDMSQPAVSQHLKVLREANLVAERREGRHRHYRLNAQPLQEISLWVAHYQDFWPKRFDALKRYLDEE